MKASVDFDPDGHHGHDLHCKTNTGEVSQTASGSTHGVYRSHKGV